MTTKKRTPRKPKMKEIPARMSNRVTMAVHVLEGIPDEKLRAVATLPAGDRLRVLLANGTTFEAAPSGRTLEERVASLERDLAHAKGTAEGAQFLANRLPEDAGARLQKLERAVGLMMASSYERATARDDAAGSEMALVEKMASALDRILPPEAVAWADKTLHGEDPDVPFPTARAAQAEA